MTVAELKRRLPQFREIFPQETPMDFSLAEYLIAIQQQEQATLAGLDAWREIGNSFQN